MGIIKRCGLYVLLFGVSFIGLSGLLSGNASAASNFDSTLKIIDTLTTGNASCNPAQFDISDNFMSILNDVDAWKNEANRLGITKEDAHSNFIDLYSGNTSSLVMRERYQDTAKLIWSESSQLELSWIENTTSRSTVRVSTVDNEEFYSINIYVSDASSFGGFDCEPRAWTLSTDTSLAVSGSDWIDGGIYATNNILANYPSGYEGNELPELPAENSEWKPNIKLLQGSNWLVELSDYNFFSFDKVAFTCGEHDLAPIINWEVWDITDDPNRVLIDTLVFAAPALVKYQAPKIQEDKKYEIVAYYSDCEGYIFTQAETRQFTIKKDGNLKSTDLAAVCITEEFPYINIPNCLGDINDMFVTLTFRTPEVDEIGGGGWGNLVDGCRELQVLDDWIMKPDVVVCPQMPNYVRSVITPIVTFALALGVITFVANRQGIRGLG